jgi:glycosyltransferase involved in cell wall biosynthesis
MRLVRGGFVVGHFTFAVPGDLATPTGGYAYDRRMVAELGDLGWRIDLLDLGEGFPWPSEATRIAAQTQLLAVPAGRIIVVDGLALGVLPEAASQLAGRNPLLALVHHPLALERGLSVEQAGALRASELMALASVQGVVVTSAATARLVAADYGVPAERITVARPGSDPARQALCSHDGSRDGIVRLLSVGAVVPRKGFDVLNAALATLTDLPWQLTIAGDRTRDRNAAAQLDADIARHALGNRIAAPGAVSPQRLAALYAEADVFVLASHFEGYGMAYAEAIAHGLPVIGTDAGAIPDTVPPEAGLLVAPGDITALAQALRRVIGDADLRRRLAAAARAAAPQLPTWRHSAEIFARVLEKLA